MFFFVFLFDSDWTIDRYSTTIKNKIEADVAELQKKVQNREEDMDKTEQKLTQAQQKLNEATVAGDESER